MLPKTMSKLPHLGLALTFERQRRGGGAAPGSERRRDLESEHVEREQLDREDGLVSSRFGHTIGP